MSPDDDKKHAEAQVNVDDGCNMTRNEDINVDEKRPVVIPVKYVVAFLIATLMSAVALELLPTALELQNLRPNSADDNAKDNAINVNQSSAPLPRSYAIYLQNNSDGHLKHVNEVLGRLGYQRSSVDSDWDLLWAHDYPFFVMSERLKDLRPHQVVNHFPGIGYLANKIILSTTGLPFQPKSFELPSQKNVFLRYARENPSAVFVVKGKEHRHISIRMPHEIQLNSSDFFVQEFIQEPFLVDGYKFDIGIYVVITAIDPLIVYIYTGDVLFRYCNAKYEPFDRGNVEKYVIGDDYRLTRRVPSLTKYYDKLSGSMRASFDAYMRDQSLDPMIVWSQVEDIVRETVLAKEGAIADILRNYKMHNFFELLRFDVIVDAKLRVHLMEVNMSPNLSSGHYECNAVLFQQVVYNVLSLVGIGSRLQETRGYGGDDESSDEMITAEKSLSTNLNMCVQHDCHRSCKADLCNLCVPCISGTEYRILAKAHSEHLHRTDMRRVFPKPILDPQRYNIDDEVKDLSDKNKWLTRWFHGKCLYDRSWCT